MNPLWRVDMHSHTHWSVDSIMKFESIQRLCARRGVDRLVVTDHNTAEGARAFQQLAPELVIVGEEIMTPQGEILAYFVRESVPAGLTPEETIRRLRNQGAVISISHPFDRYRRGAWKEEDLLRIVDKIDAVEIFNARCIHQEDNDRALAFAREHHLLGTIGSDAHSRPEYGRAVAQMRPFADAPEDFLEALREAQYVQRLSAWTVHMNSKVAKWTKKLGLQPRMWEGG